MGERDRDSAGPGTTGGDLDFEIEFYRAIVAHAPEYVDALMLLGEAYTRKGLYAAGLEIDRRLSELRPRDPVVHYNLACSYSLTRRREEALESLEKSIELGYEDLAHLARDEDLAFLHGDRTFHRLVRRLGRQILKVYRRRSGG